MINSFQRSVLACAPLQAAGFALLIALACILSPASYAQTATATPSTSPSSSSGELEEVVVSATRQGDQSVQKVPASIQVLSPTSLDQAGLPGITDFMRTLPSVNMQAQSPGVTSIEMRGLVTTFPDITTLQDRSLTSTYLDDAPIGIQSANPDLKVFDLERVEVIKGPQGTLYGAGSMAGTVRLISKKPDAHDYSGSVDVSTSETAHGGTNYSVRGVVNVPIIQDVLAVRVGAYRGDDSGFIDNLGLGRRDANDDTTTQGRVAARWTPTSSFTLDGSVTFAQLTTHGDYDTYQSLCNYCFTSLDPERFDDYFKLYNLTADQDLSFAHLIASATYQDRSFTDERTFDSFNENFLTPGIDLPATGYQENWVKEATEEVRLVSRPDEKLRWIIGGFHEYYHRYYLQIVREPKFNSVWQQLTGNPGYSNQGTYGVPENDETFWGPIDVRERQTAIFGEATYPIVPNLDFTLGARYFDFKQDFNLFFNGIEGALAPGEPLVTSNVTESKGANPRAVLNYKVTDSIMVYAQAARGFRYGGVNLPVPLQFCAGSLAQAGLKNAPPTFGPDHLWDYEIGEKGTFVDNKLLVNATGFYILWDSVQTTFPLSCGYPFIVDAGKVTSKGLELETKARATDALTLSVSGSFTDAEADGPLVNLGAPSGSRVPYFPREIVTAGAEYEVPIPGARIIWSTDYTYRSNAYTQFNTANPLSREIPSSKMLNASITYSRHPWEVALYGTNLTNNLLISTISANTNGPYQPGDVAYVGRPRTVGLRIHMGF
jgi:iron complex outermembrane receptor protein